VAGKFHQEVESAREGRHPVARHRAAARLAHLAPVGSLSDG
jgi:hypothetical protein